MSETGLASPGELKREFRRGAWLLALWLVALAGSMACGQREDFEGPAQGDAQGQKLPGINELSLEVYPQRHEQEIRAGEGFLPLGVELLPGMPMRIEVEAASGASPWGELQARGGARAPAAIRAKGAVLLRLGERLIEVGSQSVIRVSERSRPELAVNLQERDPHWDFRVKVGWGEPSVAYDPQLSNWALVPGKGRAASLLSSREAGGSHILRDLAPGTRLWIEPPEFQVDTPGEELPFPRALPGAWLAQAKDGQRELIEGSAGWMVQAGGQLSLQPNLRSGAQVAAPRVELFPALGTRAELLPMQAMRELETVELSVEPRRYHRLPLTVQAGDLVRVEIRGVNHLASRQGISAHNAGPHGGLREVPLALRNGDRGWLVPGGRERGIYAKIGERVIELQGSDAFYAPQDGRIELGVNQCFDGGDWPSYVACRRRLQAWELDLRVVVGVRRGRPLASGEE